MLSAPVNPPSEPTPPLPSPGSPPSNPSPSSQHPTVDPWQALLGPTATPEQIAKFKIGILNMINTQMQAENQRMIQAIKDMRDNNDADY